MMTDTKCFNRYASSLTN